MRHSSESLILIVAAVLSAWSPAQGPGRTVRRTRPFVLECRFKDDVFADDAAEVLKQAWLFAQKHLRPTAKMAKRKLKVIIYGDRRSYTAVAIKVNKAYAKFQGFADGRTMTAHILKIDVPWWTAATMDPPNRHVIAHEATHLLVTLCCANRGMFLPKWVSEGFPMWAEGEVMQMGGWAKDRQSDPDEGTEVRQAQLLIEAGTFPKVEDILNGKWGALSEAQAYYPIHMLWTWLDERHGDKMGALIDTLRTAAMSAALPRILQGSLRYCVGDDAWETIDADLLKFVKSREFAPMPGLVPLPHDAIGKPGDADFKPGSPAPRWLGGTTRARYVITAKVAIRAKGYPQVDLLFGRRGDEWLRVSLVPGAGVFLMAREDKKGVAGEWVVLATAPEIPTLVVDKELRVRLWARGTKITFTLDGKTAIDHDVGDRPIRGKWGVGGPMGSVASWRLVRIR